MTDIQYYWQFYKPRPIWNLTNREIWDSWPAHLRQPDVLTFIDPDYESINASFLSSHHEREQLFF